MTGKQVSRVESPQGEVSNVVLALAALERLGGAERYVDIEQVTLEVYRVAPERFSWRTRREYPSWERVRTAFVHANQQEQKRAGAPLVVSNTDGSSWKLTANGIAFIRKAVTRIGGLTHKDLIKKRSGRSADRVRQIRRHPAFSAYRHGAQIQDMPRHQIADILLCPPDSPRQSVRRKLDAAKAAALDVEDAEVKRFLESLEEEVDRKWL